MSNDSPDSEARFRAAWQLASEPPPTQPGWEDDVLKALQQPVAESAKPDLLLWQFIAAAASLLVIVAVWSVSVAAIEASVADALIQQSVEPLVGAVFL